MIDRKKTLFGLLLVSLSASLSWGAEKIKVENSDDLPRISYEIESKPSEIVVDEESIGELAKKVKADVESIFEKYEIADKGTVKSYLLTLRDIAILQGDYQKAQELNLKVREMQEKPADKLLSGLSTEAILKALKKGHKVGSKKFTNLMKKDYASNISPLPWDVVQDSVERSKGSMEMYSENLLIGMLQSTMDPGAEESKQIDMGGAAGLVSYNVMLTYILPSKQVVIDVLSDYIAENRVEKADIWAEREVDLTGAKNLNEVVVAIWDSGVDVNIFEPKNNVWKNSAEIPGDGIDNDENGWIDDVYGIAHDLKSKKDSGFLFDLPEEIDSRYDSLIDMSKGLSDLQASIDSEEATKFKKYMSNLKPDEVDAFLLDLGYFGNFTHGTHVAGIAAKGNPVIQLLTARITFDHKVIPDTPRLEEAVRGSRSYTEVVDYLKAANVRVVNMSWGGTQAGIEGAYEANGVGDDSEMRAEMARILYEIGYDGLVEAMASAPEILFIPAAGNSDEDVDFNKVIPSSISLSNVLVAGAVDQAGDETGFTSYGKNVRVHANGFEVDSYIPGGKRQKFSGTSMSAPNVTNLAAKLFAIDPSLSPEDVISLIVLGCDTTEDGRRHLMNPKKSIALLTMRNGIEL